MTQLVRVKTSSPTTEENITFCHNVEIHTQAGHRVAVWVDDNDKIQMSINDRPIEWRFDFNFPGWQNETV